MIKEFATCILFNIDEVHDILGMPDSLVKYVEENRESLAGKELLYYPRAYCLYKDDDRQWFIPANIVIGNSYKLAAKNTCEVILEDIDSVNHKESYASIVRVVDEENGGFAYKAEIPAGKKEWWDGLKLDDMVGYEWTGIHYYGIFKRDIKWVTFVTDNVVKVGICDVIVGEDPDK